LTEAERKEIVDSIKAIIEKAAAPIPPSPPSIITTILENPKQIMDRAKYTTENLRSMFEQKGNLFVAYGLAKEQEQSFEIMEK
jgi:hypothetical protein